MFHPWPHNFCMLQVQSRKKCTVIFLVWVFLCLESLEENSNSQVFSKSENSSSWPLTVIRSGSLSPPLFLNLAICMENHLGIGLACTDTLCPRKHFSVHHHYSLIYFGFLSFLLSLFLSFSYPPPPSYLFYSSFIDNVFVYSVNKEILGIWTGFNTEKMHSRNLSSTIPLWLWVK